MLHLLSPGCSRVFCIRPYFLILPTAEVKCDFHADPSMTNVAHMQSKGLTADLSMNCAVRRSRVILWYTISVLHERRDLAY